MEERNMYALKKHSGIAVGYLTVFLLIVGGLWVALGFYTGQVAFMRRQAQAEADAAALRAASSLPLYNVTGQTSDLHKTANGLQSGVVH